MQSEHTNTPGPATSRGTSFSVWPQKEQASSGIRCVYLPLPANVVLCGRPAPTADWALRWRPVRTSYGLGASSSPTTKKSCYEDEQGSPDKYRGTEFLRFGEFAALPCCQRGCTEPEGRAV
jgi:hypothetical protein